MNSFWIYLIYSFVFLKTKAIRSIRTKQSTGQEEEYKKAPHSFVFQRGHVGKNVMQLVKDMRQLMEPYTASRLQVPPTSHTNDQWIFVVVIHFLDFRYQFSLLISAEIWLGVNVWTDTFTESRDSPIKFTLENSIPTLVTYWDNALKYHDFNQDKRNYKGLSWGKGISPNIKSDQISTEITSHLPHIQMIDEQI